MTDDDRTTPLGFFNYARPSPAPQAGFLFVRVVVLNDCGWKSTVNGKTLVYPAASSGVRYMCSSRGIIAAAKGNHVSSGGNRMSYLFIILAMGPLAALGIYNPPVVHHSPARCMAEPGTINALYCSGATAETPAHHPRHKR